MLRLFSFVCGVVLAAYVVYESAVSPRKYRRLKHAIAAGETGARSRAYYEILKFEWVSAVLAFAALRFDVARFSPSHLHIGATPFGQWLLSVWNHLDAGFLMGASIGAIISVVALVVILRRARGRARQSLPGTSAWRKILPDFSALIPATLHERVLFALVALSAGICEEIVFRAWLLDALQGVAGLTGAALVVTAAMLFGLVHYYQGLPGILVTGFLGLALCGLYVASGTLLVPIVVHALIDLRVALFPPLAMEPLGSKR